MALLLTAFLAGCGEQKNDNKEEEKRIFQIESVDEKSGLVFAFLFYCLFI